MTRGSTSPMAIVAIGLAFVLGPNGCDAQLCGSTHPYVGFKSSFNSYQHEFEGDIEILNDCQFRVTMFRYDGRGPAAYWWGGASTSSFRSGFALESNPPLVSAGNGQRTVTVTLSNISPNGGGTVTWDDVGAVSLCPPTTPMVPSFDNCLVLDDGQMNLYWNLDQDGTHVTVALEAVLPETHWMGFGFSAPDAERVTMVGSDVVIAGMVRGEPFAIDYSLTKYEQCNYNAPPPNAGVCPDSLLASDPSADHAQLLFAERNSERGVTMIAFRKPLKSGGATGDVDWPGDGEMARFSVWGRGPMSEESTAEVPVVLYHGAARAPYDFKVTLGGSTFGCGASVLGAAPSPPPAPTEPVAVINMDGSEDGHVVKIEVTTGSNANYPNPPAWGLSYHFNGEESPVLRVQRGVEYTFAIVAGPTHPFYITDDITGGNSNPNQIVYAGGEDSHGTPEAPYILKWTPGPDTPNLLYYQCWVHQKLGWQVLVVDEIDAGCPKTHPYVGFKGKLSEREHDVRGDVVVVDDCTFKVTSFGYDGRGPAAFWWGSSGALKDGFRLREGQTQAGDGTREVVVTLKEGITWDDIKTLSVWCEEFTANFGSVDLAAPAKPACAPLPTAGGGEATFEFCEDFPKYELLWTTNADGSTSFGMRAGGGGWAAFAIPRTPGVMVGSSAVIGWADGGEAQAGHYSLGARSPMGVTSAGAELPVSDISAAPLPDGGVAMRWTLSSLALPAAGARRLLQDAPGGVTNVLWARGPAPGPGSSLGGHRPGDRGPAQVNFATGSAAVKTPSVKMLQVHGWLMAVSWGFMIPLGVVTARCFKEWDPAWFNVHRALNGGGYIVSVVGVAIGLSEGSGTYNTHRGIGLAVTALGAAQALMGVARPHKGAANRRYFELFHWWGGRLAVFLAVYNVYQGLGILQPGDGYRAAYTAAIVSVAALGIFMESRDHLRRAAEADSAAIRVEMSSQAK